MKLYIDFETASDLDLPKVGAYRYADHVTTFARMLCWAVDDDDVQTWWHGQPMPEDLKDAIQTAEHVVAWNAQFERLIFKAMVADVPKPTWNQWYCAAAQARANAMPGSLADCARAMQLPIQKGDTRLMKKLAHADYQPTNKELLELEAYCQRDVEVTREIHNRLAQLPPDELYMYRLNERINDRGVLIDCDYVSNMVDLLDAATRELNTELSTLTNGAITTVMQHKRMASLLGVSSVDKRAVEELLADPDLLPVHRRILEIRQLGAKSSTAKYRSMRDMVNHDHRLRGMFKYAGAGQTGRFSGVGPQLHNLTRDVEDNAELKVEVLKRVGYKRYKICFDEPLIPLASRMIRPALVAPPGKTFVIGDFSAVEAKGVPWLAEVEVDVDYVRDAMDVFGVQRNQVTPDLRQAGKVVRLACGFGGKGGALMTMARGYGLEMHEADAQRHAEAWHRANPWAVKLGKAYERAAMKAVQNPYDTFAAGRCVYLSENRDGVQILRCMLPSGRVISYFDVRIEEGQYGPGLTSLKPRTGLREWLWYGLISENNTQAMCNDLLRHSMVQLDLEHYPIVAHVHDENVLEVDEERAAEECALVKAIMERRPDWAADFPLEAKVHASPRYTK